MSLILEALKRSQQEREEAQAPVSPINPSPGTKAAGNSNRLLIPLMIAVIAALGLGALLLIALRPIKTVQLQPSNQSPLAETGSNKVKALPETAPDETIAGKSGGDTATIADRQQTRLPLKSTAAPSSKPALPTNDISAKPKPSSPDRETASSQQQQRQRMREELLSLKRQIEADSASSPVTQPATPTDQPLPGKQKPIQKPAPNVELDSPPAIHELPPELQSQLAEIVISVLVYSENPERRFVQINGEKLHQGEQSGDGLTIAEILPRSVILKFRKHRFEKTVSGFR